jgi:hypothetical protein
VFSEALDVISARSPANYQFIEAGPDEAFDTLDDVIIALNPAYSFPETNLVLELLNGVLPDGRYRLTISGTQTVYDTAGNPLDGDPTNPGADNFVYVLIIDRASNIVPVADPQSVNVDEDGSIPTITLTGSDGDVLDVLTFGIISSPAHGTLSGFDSAAGTVTYTPNPNYNGPDSFTFQVDDGKLGTATAVVSITVDPVNDVPTAVSQSVNVSENTTWLIVLGGTDLETAMAAARLKGHLPAAHSGAVAPVPTVEDVLGDQAKPRVAPPLGGPTEYLRDPDEILNGAEPDTEEPVAGSSFTRAELDEINRMNPRPSGQQRPKRK